MKAGVRAGRGNKITEIPADEVKRWKDASQPVVDEWIAEVTSKGYDGRKLYERAVGFLVEKYSPETERRKVEIAGALGSGRFAWGTPGAAVARAGWAAGALRGGDGLGPA